jgi:site-specific DNA-methyltransferase (adenine-specific)
MTKKLYYGDNLTVLREHIASETVDLVYLDPPFNSNATYNVLFRSPTGTRAEAQVEAFEDTWHWGEESALAFDQVLQGDNVAAAKVLRALRDFLGENDMMAYLAMMAVRLIELHRVLKPKGSLYLHCDPTASHYLKLVLDSIFHLDCYRAEIVWKRTNARGTKKIWPKLHDVIFQYTKSDIFTFNTAISKAETAKTPHTLITGLDGLKYQTYELTGAGLRPGGETGQPWRGFDPARLGRHWGYNHSQLDEWEAAGQIHWPKDGGFPRRRDEYPFDPEARTVVVGDVWTDIDRLNQTAKERLGYPTQKPLALLERIIQASSNSGDLVLDPFCGCGTAVHAAEKLGRNWIGIDITCLAINLIERRLKDAFPAVQFDVIGTPATLQDAEELARRDKHEFERWAVYAIGARPNKPKAKQKGADKGIDGVLFFRPDARTIETCLVSVKAGDNVGVAMVRDLRGTMEREKAAIGVLITAVLPTRAMETEAAAAGFFEYETSEGGKAKVPRLQIITLAEIFQGKRPRIPLADAASTFKTAAREPREKKEDQGKLL